MTVNANAGSAGDEGYGIATKGDAYSDLTGNANNAFLAYRSGNVYYHGASIFNIGGIGAASIVCVAIDLDNLRGWIRNGASGLWNNSSTANPTTPSSGVDLSAVFGANAPVPATCSDTSGASVTANFGQGAFSGAVPSGFTAGWTGAPAPLIGLITTKANAFAVATQPDAGVRKTNAFAVATQPNAGVRKANAYAVTISGAFASKLGGYAVVAPTMATKVKGAVVLISLGPCQAWPPCPSFAKPDPYYDLLSVLPAGYDLQHTEWDALWCAYALNCFQPLTPAQALAAVASVSGPQPVYPASLPNLPDSPNFSETWR